MPVNSTHADYDLMLAAWLRARDVFAGEDAVKAGGGAVALLLTIFRHHGWRRGGVQPLTLSPGDRVALASLVFGKDVEPKCGLTHGA